MDANINTFYKKAINEHENRKKTNDCSKEKNITYYIMFQIINATYMHILSMHVQQ